MQKKIYMICSVICFTLCIVILKFLGGIPFIRGFMGDVVFTMMVYFIIRSMSSIKYQRVALITLMITYTAEILQYFKFAYRVGFLNNRIGRILFGTTFDFNDLIAYTIGVVLVYFIDGLLIIKDNSL